MAGLHQVGGRGRPVAQRDERGAGAGQVHVERALMVEIAEHARRAIEVEVGAGIVEAHGGERAVAGDPPALRDARDPGGTEALDDREVAALHASFSSPTASFASQR